MRKFGLKASVLVLVATLVGCVTVQSTRLGSGVIHAPVPPDRVAIYMSPSQVPGKYTEVALLDASGDYAYTNEEEMFAKLRKRAGALGANGVILERIKEPGTGAKVFRALLGTPADRRGRAIAIYVQPGSAGN